MEPLVDLFATQQSLARPINIWVDMAC